MRGIVSYYANSFNPHLMLELIQMKNDILYSSGCNKYFSGFVKTVCRHHVCIITLLYVCLYNYL